MAQETLYVMQASFTAGEVSPEVANRIDLEKYNSALLNAENCCIRPYGAVIRRGGTLYCGTAKYADKRCILRPFGIGYLLEFGVGYVRVWKDGALLTNSECVTPYTESDLNRLRFAQSADVLFIASGSHPLMTLSRYSDTDWRFEEYEITPYYDAMLGGTLERGAEEHYGKPGQYTYIAPESGTYTITIAGGGGGGGGSAMVGYMKTDPHNAWIITDSSSGGSGGNGEVRTIQKTLTKNQSYSFTVGSGGSAGGITKLKNSKQYNGNPGGAGGSSVFDGETAKGGGGGTGASIKESGKHGSTSPGTNGTSYGNGGAGGGPSSAGASGWVDIKMDAEMEITPSGTTGTITLKANKSFFTSALVGSYMKIQHLMPSKTITQNGSGTSAEVLCGNQWKVVTHGTWTGSVKIQKSEEGKEWQDYREYKSNDDFNASESGTVDIYTRLRIVATAGNTDLTVLPYTHEGIVQITAVASATSATAKVIEPLGSTDPISGYMFGAWSNYYGWPSAICFFQDRLCLAATKEQPYNVWMSRTGDYPNFSVEKVSGTITDDSAVALSFISRKQNAIKHLVPASDLVVLTEGNEWIVSGGSTVTPTEATPKVQTSRGCTDVIPISVGSRIVFVQRRGKTVRDMGYSFESDNYDGMDLTLLAKHLTSDTEIIDATYMQDPDSILYFVLANGEIDCLSYVQDQKVYAWSHLVTDGDFESVCDVEEEDRDVVYTVVKRTLGGNVIRCIEKFMPVEDSDIPDDYIMMDCAGCLKGEQRSSAKAPWLAGETVGVLANGRYYKNIHVDEEGSFTIPAQAASMIVGLPYRTTIELQNVEISTQKGTVQGRYKNVRGASLRLIHTLGGRIGNGVGPMDEIKYDEFSAQKVTLYSDDKEVTIPNPGVEKHGRVRIETEEPYPFNLAAIVREVVINE